MTKPTPRVLAIGAVAILVLILIGIFAIPRTIRMMAERGQVSAEPLPPVEPSLDKAAYDAKLLQLANLPAPKPVVATTSEQGDTGTTTVEPEKAALWPVKAAYPNYGAILPFHRIIAYYGNFYSKGMGVLGEYPEDTMLEMLNTEVRAWQDADPSTPVMPAIDYIAVTAQLSPGKDGMYRLRMPTSQIDKAILLAKKVAGIVILEVQPGLADLMGEVKELEPYLTNPIVHLAIDPEFSMKTKARPGTVVGTVDATDINRVNAYLAELVQTHDLPPKVLVVHRYTRAMVTNATKIVPLPEVQIVMDMDGWGPGPKKYSTYNSFIVPEPVQFTGFKLFYKNDIKQPGTKLLTPAELLKLSPIPSFIQFQ